MKSKEQPVNRSAFVVTLALLLQACGDTGSKPATPAPAAIPAPAANSAAAPASDPMREGTEKLFQNPFDTDAVYLLSQKTGTPEALAVLVKRVSQNGVQYSRWLFNCTEKTAQNMGVAESIQALDIAANSMPSKSQPYEDKSKIGAIATTVCQS
jgi:hypothetical protein